MNGTRFLSRLTGLMHGKGGVASDPAPVLLGLAGFDGKLKFLNPAWEKILGYPAQELLDRPLRELMQQHGQAAVALVERLLAGTTSSRWNSACAAGTALSNGSYGTGGSIRSTRRSSLRGTTSPSKRPGRSHRYYGSLNDRKGLTPRFELRQGPWPERPMTRA